MLVTGGSQVNEEGVNVGTGTDSTGSITITGAGSAITCDRLNVGGGLSSTVTVSSGATVIVGLVNNGGSITINGGTLNAAVLGTPGTGTINLTDPVGGHALVISENGQYAVVGYTFAGSIVGTGSVDVVSTIESQGLSGVNSYTGGTFISAAGDLLIAGVGSLPAGGW